MNNMVYLVINTCYLILRIILYLVKEVSLPQFTDIETKVQ